VINNFKGFGGNGAAIADGFKVSNQLTIKSIVFQNKGVAPGVLRINGVNYSQYVTQIKLQFESQVGTDKKELHDRYIEVPILVDPTTNLISQCHLETTLAEACTAMGGIFDVPSGTCKPAVNCQMKGSYIVLTCSPNTYGCDPSAAANNYINPLTGDASCPANSSPSTTGKYDHTHVADTGKKSTVTVTDTETFYVCMQCN
jgi:hypothetical protein